MLYLSANDNEDTYVDDCVSGEDSGADRNKVTDGLVLMLSKGGFSLKGYTFSGFDPPKHLTKNGCSIQLVGQIGGPRMMIYH